MDKSTFSILFIMQKGKPNAQGNAPIFARITINHQMTHLATRYYLPADRWLPKEGRTVGRTKEEKEVNAYLDNLRGHSNAVVKSDLVNNLVLFRIIILSSFRVRVLRFCRATACADAACSNQSS